ncbi:MAG: yliI 1 [Nocardioides sp.]|nr:yliI 1 [Nocardioides sp.]
MRAVALALTGALSLAGCSQGGNESTVTITGTPPPHGPSSTPGGTTDPTTDVSPSGSPGTTAPPAGPVEVVATIATGLEAPWGLDFFANGDAIITERDTERVSLISGPDHVVKQVGTLDLAVPQVEAGLLGVAISPDFSSDHLVYFYVSTESDNRVVRARLEGGVLGPPETVFSGIPNGLIHDGGRLVFGPDGFLYVSTGEGGEPERAQDKSSLGGKILRITPDGDPAPGNPFHTAVWSYGHRNIQGLAFVGDQLWASEFGDSTVDELNRIERGGNYGWPQVEGEGGTDQGFIDPQVTWSVDEASPSGLAYADGYLWLAALRGERLWRVAVDAQGATATNPKAFFVGEYGRMRTVEFAPDGMLWLMTSNRDGRGTPVAGDDRILLIRP